MSHRSGWFAAALLLFGLGVAGCSKSAASESGIGGDPASVTAIDGPGDLHRIELTTDAAQRIGLTTDTVRLLPASTLTGGSGKQLAVAVGAVLYDQDGVTWVYVESAPLTFQRQRVTLSRVDGDVAVLQSGPAPGTAVANVGAAELRGSEDGVPGE